MKNLLCVGVEYNVTTKIMLKGYVIKNENVITLERNVKNILSLIKNFSVTLDVGIIFLMEINQNEGSMTLLFSATSTWKDLRKV